jgi:hypothetical protein
VPTTTATTTILATITTTTTATATTTSNATATTTANANANANATPMPSPPPQKPRATFGWLGRCWLQPGRMAGGGGSPHLHLLIFLMAYLCSLMFKIGPFLARQSRHCLILLTTFVTVLIVHIVGIVRVHIWDTQNPEVWHTYILYQYPR